MKHSFRRAVAATAAIAAVGFTGLISAGSASAAGLGEGDVPARYEGPLVQQLTGGSKARVVAAFGATLTTEWGVGQRLDTAEAQTALLTDEYLAALPQFSFPGSEPGPIISLDTGQCLTILSPFVDEGLKKFEVLPLMDCDGSSNQQFELLPGKSTGTTSSSKYLYVAGTKKVVDLQFANAVWSTLYSVWPASDLGVKAEQVISPLATDEPVVNQLDASVTVSGTATPGATIEVTVGDQTVTVTADPDGSWTATVSDLPAGDNTVAITQIIDGTEQDSTTVDAYIKARVTAEAGTVNDKAGTLPLSGTGEPGETVYVWLGGTVKSVEVAEDGSWSMELANLPVGASTVNIFQGDGETLSSQTSVDVTRGEYVVTDVTIGEAIVDENAKSVTVTGTGEPGASIEVTVGETTETVTVAPDGTWTTTVQPIPSGESTVTVTQKDGDDESSTSTVVTLAPDAPELGELVVNQEDKSVTVSGTGEAGAEIEVTVGGRTETVTVAPDGTWNVTVQPVPSGDSDVSVVQKVDGVESQPATGSVHVNSDVTARIETQDDKAGSAVLTGTGEPGAEVEVTVGGTTQTVTVAPDGTWTSTVTDLTLGENTVTVSQKVDGQASGSTSMTINRSEIEADPVVIGDVVVDQDERSATMSGSGEPGAEIVVTVGDATETVTVAPDGTWTATVKPLPAGTSTITVTQKVDGKGAGTASTEVSIDAVAPAVNAPVVNNEEKSATFTGTGEPGAQVEVTVAGKAETVTVAPDGTWTATVDGLPTGTNTATVTQTVGGQAAGSVTVDVTVEEIPPAVVPFTAEVKSLDNEEGTAVIGGMGEAGAEIRYTVNGAEKITTVAPDGTWTAALTGLSAGQVDATVSQWIDGAQVGDSIDLTIVIQEVPLMDPAIAAGGLGLLALAGAPMFLRRRMFTKENAQATAA